jgi:formylmethanofuran dehydrogenase subunit E
LLGGLLGATAGSVAGSRLGDVVDEHYLGNCECQDCGAVFTSPSRS